MAKRLDILSKKNIEFHNNPPKFNAEQRKNYFYKSKEIEALLSKIRSKENKVYFFVNYVYLKETAQFYSKVYQRDLDFVCKALDFDCADISWENYNKDSQRTHRKILLSHFELSAFNASTNAEFTNEISRLLHQNKSPRSIFYSMINYLRENDVVIPNYEELADLITKAHETKNSTLIDVVKRNLTEEGKEKLEALLVKDEMESTGKTKYKLTHTKRFSHSTKLNKIRANIQLHKELYEIYSVVKPVFLELDLSNENVKSFASTVRYRDVFRFKRTDCYNRYLHLIVYVANQFYRLQDILIRSYISILKAAIKNAEKDAKDEYFRNQNLHIEAINVLNEEKESLISTVRKTMLTLEDPSFTYKDRVEKALQLLKRERVIKTEEEEDDIDFNMVSAENIFMKHLEKLSQSLTNKCKPILLALNYDFEETQKQIGETIKKYRDFEGNIDSSFSLRILPGKYRESVGKGTDFKTGLYSVLFFNEVSKRIISEEINFHDSYEYTSLDSLQIPLDDYQKNRDYYLEKADMLQFSSWKKLKNKLSLTLDSEYHTINRRIIDDKNSFIQIDSDGIMQVCIQKNTQLSTLMLSPKERLYPDEGTIPLCEVLATVNAATGFLDEFTHKSIRGVNSRPTERDLIAAIMGHGFHFGPKKFAKLSDELNKDTLENISKEYFSKGNLNNSNDPIIQLLDKLPVAELFNNGHTSSDGQKYSVSNETLHGNYSFKYGGKDKVIVPYNFIDSRSASFNSLIAEGSRKESHYMLDGVLNNNVVQTEMHSTDTHGYSEATFCLSGFTGINFAPRLKKFQKSGLTAFKTRGSYERSGYPVLPSFRVKEKTIEESYEGLLRLAVSLKLGYTTSEKIFRRLNSYSKHNPLYVALVELGRVWKTSHLLRYMNDESYRSDIQVQLNKGESLNKLDRALAIGSPDYSEVDKDDQSITETCKRLIKNCLICWNYMYLSQRLLDAKDNKEKQYIISRILETSVVSWQHFQIHGKFDLSDRQLVDSRDFNVSKMFNPSILDVD